MTSRSEAVTIDGHEIRLSNLDKVLYPDSGTTKGDVVDYYRRIADVLVPHSRDRAATRKRWPDGVGVDGEGESFFQKNLGRGTPDWVDRRRIRHRDHVNTYPLVDDEATLVWLAQLASLEIHVPQWCFGEGDEQLPPDRMVLDLDPGPGIDLRGCADVARLVRARLREDGLECVPVTSGSKGIHVYAGLDGSRTSDEVAEYAHDLARALEEAHPDDVISTMRREDRRGKVFIDWSQNGPTKTTVTPYSLRGRPHPTVAAPRTWRELASPHLRQLEYREVLRRVRRRGDPMAGLEGRGPTREPSRGRRRGGDAQADDDARHPAPSAGFRATRDGRRPMRTNRLRAHELRAHEPARRAA